MESDIEKRRHSAAHLLAMAMLRLFPNSKLGVGPVTKDGFYHDVEASKRLSWQDVKRIETEMNLIMEENLPFTQFYTSKQEAFQLVLTQGQVFKSELIQQIDDEQISFYKTGEEFADPCRGPHVNSTREVGAIKLLSVTDVHWKNDTSRPQMQRISGVAFETAEELNQYTKKLEAIQNKDFLKKATELNYLTGTQDYNYTADGTILRNVVVDRFSINLAKQGFSEVMNFKTDDLQGAYNTMHQIYKTKNHSYRNLPVRFYNLSLMQVEEPRNIYHKWLDRFTQINALEVLTPEDIKESITSYFNNILQIYTELEIEFNVEIHSADIRQESITTLSDLLRAAGISQSQIIDADAPEDGFIVRFLVEDELERRAEIATVSLRASQAEYVDSDGEFKSAYELFLRTNFESILAYYLEEIEGNIPYWAAPTQAVIIPIGKDQRNYAIKVAGLMIQNGYRAEVDDRSETMQARIRSAEMQKSPVILVVGEKEENSESVSVRIRNNKEVGLVSVENLVTQLDDLLSQS